MSAEPSYRNGEEIPEDVVAEFFVAPKVLFCASSISTQRSSRQDQAAGGVTAPY